jgi:hypothetical protein
MHKAGTITEMLALKGKIPEEVYLAALRLVTILDGMYGEERDIDKDDGGIVLFAENKADLEAFSRNYIPIGANRHEAVDIIQAKPEPYLNVLFLCNNEYGINLFLPVSIAPEIFLRDK